MVLSRAFSSSIKHRLHAKSCEIELRISLQRDEWLHAIARWEMTRSPQIVDNSGARIKTRVRNSSLGRGESIHQ